MPLVDYIPSGRRNRILIGGTGAVGLIISISAAIAALGPQAAFWVETPDNERAIEISTYGAIGVGTGATPFGSIGDCLKSGGGSGKLMSFSSCGGSSGGGSNWSNTGSLESYLASKFVNVSGDTMTGTLNIKNGGNLHVIGTISGTTLKILATGSGNVLHGEKGLSSSGTLVWEGVASGSSLYVATSLTGIGLVDCDLATQTLAWDASSGRFSCGTDADTMYQAGQGLSLAGTSFSVNGTLTGSLLRFLTISGGLLYAKNTLSSSGTLVFEGAASGSSLYLGTSLNGAGLTDCDADNQTVAWDATSGRFSCGDDDSGGAGTPEVGTSAFSGGVLRLGDPRYVNTSGDTMTGTLNISGGLLLMNDVLGNSGIYASSDKVAGGYFLVTNPNGGGVAEFSNAAVVLNDAGTDTNIRMEGDTDANLFFLDASTDSIGIGMSDPETKFDVLGTISGASIRASTSFDGAGLVDCDLATQTLAWDATSKKFSCGNDADTTYIAGNGITLTGNSFALNATVTGSTLSGTKLIVSKLATISGSLVVRDTIRVFGSVSGSLLHGEKTLSSSGTLVWEGAASGSTLYVATSFDGAGLGTDCDGAGAALLWDATNKRFSCGVDDGGTAAPEVGTSSFSGAVLTLGNDRWVNDNGDTMTGALTIDLSSGFIGLKVIETGSGRIFHAEKEISSSGTIIATGNIASRGVLSGYSLVVNGTAQFFSPSGGVSFSDKSGNQIATILDDGTHDFVVSDPSGDVAFKVLSTDTTQDSAFMFNGTYVANFLTDTNTQQLLLYAFDGQNDDALNVQTAGLGTVFHVTASGGAVFNQASLTDADFQVNTLNDSAALFVKGSSDAVGIGTSVPKAKLDVAGNFSGANLIISNQASFSGTTTMKKSGGSVNTVALKVLNTVSGAVLHGEKTLNSSGSLVWEGAASGSTLYVATSLNGAGLADCDTGATSKLLWDATSGRFSCGTDQTGGAGAPEVGTASFSGAVLRLTSSGSVHMAKMTRDSAQSIPDQSTVKVYLDTEEFDIGNIANVTAGASGSGRVTIQKAGRYLVTASYGPSSNTNETHVYIYKNNAAVAQNDNDHVSIVGTDTIQVVDTLSLVAGDYIEMYVRHRVGSSNSTPTSAARKPRLSVVQIQDNLTGGFWTLSGSNIFNSNASNVGIGTRRPGSKLSISGSVIISKDGRLDSNSSDANLSLEVVGIISGSVLRASSTLASSGALVFEGAGSGNSLTVSNLGNCNNVTSNKGSLQCSQMVIKRKSADESVASSTVLQQDDDLFFSMGSSETWIYQFNLAAFSTSATPDLKLAVAAPSGSTCSAHAHIIAPSAAAAQDASANTAICGNAMALTINTADQINPSVVWGSITTSGTSGSGMLKWAQNSSNATATQILSGSTVIAFKAIGSDLAEVYYSKEGPIMPGTVVSMDDSIFAGVKPSSIAYDEKVLGVVSTKPAQTIGGDDGPINGSPTFIGIAGRVPVLVTDENGSIQSGDYLTTSSRPGYAMKATKAGPTIGLALTSLNGSEGVVTMFIKNGFYFPHSTLGVGSCSQ